ncbi:LOW QUALITY PROTEIN: taste receptor type 2 member 1-like [Carettochelys insculpta]|uniref:LOW QUALITY PROTEIN: taste receptor type 2 member 1-like n=1 Tax=Carettochelys insculpta TaxID=44489 RepID=UPI003EBAD02F
MFPALIIALIIFVTEFILGIIANGLIIIVNCTEWISSRKLTCCDMILTSLGICRFLLHFSIFINIIFFAFSTVMDGQCIIWIIMYLLWKYLNTLSIWLATWLSVFYCVKIANFGQPLFCWLKQRISRLLPQLLRSSLLLSLISCLFSVSDIGIWHIDNSMNNLSGNTSMECRYKVHSSASFAILSMLGYSFLFFIFIVPAILLITSLWRHTKRMRKTASSFRDTVTEAHVSAIKCMISFIFFVSYLVAVVLVLSQMFAHRNICVSCFCIAVMAAYPSGHSVVLILGNPKLKRAALKALNYVKCRLRDEAS